MSFRLLNDLRARFRMLPYPCVETWENLQTAKMKQQEQIKQYVTLATPLRKSVTGIVAEYACHLFTEGTIGAILCEENEAAVTEAYRDIDAKFRNNLSAPAALPVQPQDTLPQQLFTKADAYSRMLYLSGHHNVYYLSERLPTFNPTPTNVRGFQLCLDVQEVSCIYNVRLEHRIPPKDDQATVIAIKEALQKLHNATVFS